jgi:hypothetical protein
MKKSLLLLILLNLAALNSYSQFSLDHNHQVVVSFLQIKDEMNYGLVFRGPGLGFTYSSERQNDRLLIDYQARISMSVVMTRDILAPSFNLVPVRFGTLFNTGPMKHFLIGPYLVAEYNYELYPDLQSGYSFWFTHFSMGAAATGWFSFGKHRIDLSLFTTVFGFTSRQPVYDDPYFYDLSFSDVIKDLHQDLQFGSWGKYNQTEFEIRWKPDKHSRMAFAYLLQYYGYFDEPSLGMLNQSVKLIFLPKD